MIVIGADSHKRTHTVVALDAVGRRLAEKFNVGVQVVQDQHDRAAELLMGGVEQPGIVGLGQTLASAGAAAGFFASMPA